MYKPKYNIKDRERKLSKKVCRKCHESNKRDICKGGYKVRHRWTTYDDDKWHNFFVDCPAGVKIMQTWINNVPEKCPYQLEHLMFRELENA